MTASPIEVSCVDGIARLRLANADSGNVFNLEMIEALSSAIQSITPGNARVVLINAEGRNFSLGGDLNGMRAALDRSSLLDRMAQGFHAGLKALDNLGLPVVTAVNGAAAGAGLSLAIAGDIVIGSANSSYLMAYSAIGLSPDGGGTHYLPRLIGMRLTQEMAFLNRRLTAAEALTVGLITRLVDDTALQSESEAVAKQLASGPTFAYRKIKKLLGQSFARPLPDQLDLEAAAIAACAGTGDAAEGVNAFLARQQPHFMGK